MSELHKFGLLKPGSYGNFSRNFISEARIAPIRKDMRNSSDLSGPKNNSDKRISHLKEVFLSDLSYQWSLTEMARKVNVSASHLNRLFKVETGLSPLQFLRELRLERAADLLENTFLSVKEIRFRAGLNDKSRFIKDFRKKYGTTPTEFRRQSSKTISANKDEIANREKGK